MAGCPHKCKGCHNEHMWNYDDGYDVEISSVIDKIKCAITANGLKRNLSILGGEPLASYNLEYTTTIINEIRKSFPDIEIYLWTGYTIDNMDRSTIKDILKNVDVIIDGKYDEKLRDVSLPLRGSSNQRVLVKGDY